MAEQHSMIELQGIIKRFYIGQPNELEILHGIDLKVNRGEFVSVVGSSGSGKTTMMNIIGSDLQSDQPDQCPEKCRTAHALFGNRQKGAYRTGKGTFKYGRNGRTDVAHTG